MLIILNAPFNVNAWAVCRALYKKVPRCDWAYVDPLGQLEQQTGNCPLEVSTGLREALEIARASFAKRRRRVIVWRLTPWALDQFTYALRGMDDPILVFTLAPPMQFALSSHSGFEQGIEDRLLIRAFYTDGRNKLGFVIDNKEQTGEQTAAVILEHLRKEMFLV